jgi:cold shock protein
MDGDVKWYDKKKGYGFIDSQVKSNIFVHYASFLDGLNMLEEGQQVTFKVAEGEKGLRSNKGYPERKSNPLIRFAI